MMVRFQFPAEAGNEVIRSGKIQKFFDAIMPDLKPEAAYFFPEGGQRAGLLVFDMQESSQVVDVVERFCFGLGANVEMTPVMNAEDIQKGMAKLPGIIERYG